MQHILSGADCPRVGRESVLLFVVDKVALEQIVFKVLQFSPGSIIPPLLRIHLASTRCSQQKDKRAKLGNLPKVSGLSEMGER